MSQRAREKAELLRKRKEAEREAARALREKKKLDEELKQLDQEEEEEEETSEGDEANPWDPVSMLCDKPLSFPHPLFLTICLVVLPLLWFRFGQNLDQRPLHRDEGVTASTVLQALQHHSASGPAAGFAGMTMRLLGPVVIRLSHWLRMQGLLVLSTGTLTPAALRAAGGVLSFTTVLLLVGGTRHRLGDCAGLIILALSLTNAEVLFFSRFFSSDSLAMPLVVAVFAFGSRLLASNGTSIGSMVMCGLCALALLGLPPVGPWLLATLLLAASLARILCISIAGETPTKEKGWVQSALLPRIGLGVSAWLLSSLLFSGLSLERETVSALEALESGKAEEAVSFLSAIPQHLDTLSGAWLLRALTKTQLLSWTCTLGLPVLAVLREDPTGLTLGFWALLLIPTYSLLPSYSTMALPCVCVVLFLSASYFISRLLVAIFAVKNWRFRAVCLLALAVVVVVLQGLDMRTTKPLGQAQKLDLKDFAIGEQQVGRQYSAVVDQIRRVAEATGKFIHLPIHVTLPRHEAEPLPYYLRDYTHVTYAPGSHSSRFLPAAEFDKSKNQHLASAVVIIAATHQADALVDFLASVPCDRHTFSWTKKLELALYAREGAAGSSEEELRRSATAPATPAKEASTMMGPDPRYQDKLVKGLTWSVYEGKQYDKKGQQLLTESTQRKPELKFFYGMTDARPFTSPFSYVWRGFLSISQPGPYYFALSSDDGSMLYIDNELVVDNGGDHALKTSSGVINLARGLHYVKICYMDWVGEVEFMLAIKPPGAKKASLPKDIFWTYADPAIWKRAVNEASTGLSPDMDLPESVQIVEVGPPGLGEEQNAIRAGIFKWSGVARSIAIISGYDGSKYKPMGRLSSDTKLKYALLHGYSYFCDNDLIAQAGSGFNDRSSARTRVFDRHWNQGFEWLLWLDSDILITNPAIRLEPIIEKYAPDGSNVHVMLTKDWGGQQPNPGAMFIQVSPQGKAFLQKWITHIELHDFHDDLLAIRDGMIPKQEPEVAYIGWIPQHEINSYPHLSLVHEPWNETTGEHHRSHARWEPGHLLVHVINCLRQYHLIDSESCDGIAAWYWQHFNNEFGKLVTKFPHVRKQLKALKKGKAEGQPLDWTLAFPAERCDSFMEASSKDKAAATAAAQ